MSFWESGQQIPELPSCGHGMDEHLLTAFEDEHDGLEQSRLRVEAKTQLSVWSLVFFERFDPQRPVGGMDGVLGQHSVFERAVMDLHAA